MIIEERKAYTDAHFNHALRIGPELAAKLNLLEGKTVAAPVAADPEPASLAPSLAEPLPARSLTPDLPFNLRQSLGLE